jgi:hypothetical protein
LPRLFTQRSGELILAEGGLDLLAGFPLELLRQLQDVGIAPGEQRVRAGFGDELRGRAERRRILFFATKHGRYPWATRGNRGPGRSPAVRIVFSGYSREQFGRQFAAGGQAVLRDEP